MQTGVDVFQLESLDFAVLSSQSAAGKSVQSLIGADIRRIFYAVSFNSTCFKTHMIPNIFL